MNVQRTIVVEGDLARPILFSADDYLLASRHGVLDHHEKTELIEGVILAVNAQYSLHGRVQRDLVLALVQVCNGRDDGLEVWFEVSVALSDDSVPRPDIVLAKNMPHNAPAPIDAISLVVEVATSSLSFDLGTRLCLYAEACIPEYWVADVNARVIHQMWSPADGAYAERRQIAFGEPITAATLSDLTVATDRLA